MHDPSGPGGECSQPAAMGMLVSLGPTHIAGRGMKPAAVMAAWVRVRASGSWRPVSGASGTWVHEQAEAGGQLRLDAGVEDQGVPALVNHAGRLESGVRVRRAGGFEFQRFQSDLLGDAQRHTGVVELDGRSDRGEFVGG